MNFGLQDGDLQGWGFNGKVSEFTAAIGLAQNTEFDSHLRERHTAAQVYAEIFSSKVPDWGLAFEPGTPPWQAYPVLAPTAELADRFEKIAAQAGVQTRRYYRPALHTAPGLESLTFGQRLPISEDLAQRMVCLPMYSRWGEGECADLRNILNTVLENL